MTTAHAPQPSLEDHDSQMTNGQGGPRTGREAGSRSSRSLRIVAVVVVIAAGVWAWWANWGPGAPPAMEMTTRVQAGSAIPVVVAEVMRGSIAGTVSYTGSVAAFNEEDIYPRVTGRIVEMSVYPGDAVRAGQIVARLDDVELSWRLREAEAMARVAVAGRAQMEADLLAARHNIAQMEKELAMVDAEVAYSEAVAGRSERLIAAGSISRQEYENDVAMARSQAAKRDAARAKLEQARAMEAAARRKVEAGEAMVAQGEANLRAAGVVHGYVNIVAPNGGYVVKRLVAPGVLVQPGMAILKTAQIDRVRLQANVGERDLAVIKVGSAVHVRRSGERREEGLTARVTSVAPFADVGSRTAVVEAVVPNGERRFLPGQYVTMEFTTGSRTDVLTVPRDALGRLDGHTTVWVVANGAVERREVAVGLQSPERVEVISGLGPAERVVARGQDALYAGARITAITPPTPARSAVAPTPSAAPGPAPTKRDPHAGH
jgi:multidrug efflux pump subunit AcrA (membrane-fusion protein)